MTMPGEATASTDDLAARNEGALGSGPLGRCASIATIVVAADIGSKIVATSVLGGSVVPLGHGTFLGVVYNDAFARGAMLGSLTIPATLLLAAFVLYLIVRACAPLATIDVAAPRALGLVAGAATANALDFVRTGRGVVDFLGVPTAQGAIVFNLADVAAYAGAALLARTAWRVGHAAWREQMITARAPRYPRLRAAAEQAWAQRQSPRRNLELVRPVPIFVEHSPDAAPEDVVPVPPRPPLPPSAGRRVPPALGESDLSSDLSMGRQSPVTRAVDPQSRPALTLLDAGRPPRR